MENVGNIKKQETGIKRLTKLGKEEDLVTHLEKARRELAHLKEKQELIEREEEELDRLRSQNEELAKDRKEVYNTLTSRIAEFEEEEDEVKRRHQEVSSTGKLLKTVLKGLEMADKESKKNSDIRRRIPIDREAVNKAREALDRLGIKAGSDTFGESYEAGGRRDSSLFLDMREAFKIGVGFFLAGALVTVILYILSRIFGV